MKILFDQTGPALGSRPTRSASLDRRSTGGSRLTFDELEVLVRTIAAELHAGCAPPSEPRSTCRRLYLGQRMARVVRHGHCARSRGSNRLFGL